MMFIMKFVKGLVMLKIWKYKCGDLVIFNYSECGNISGVIIECLEGHPYPMYILKSKYISNPIKLFEPQIVCVVGMV